MRKRLIGDQRGKEAAILAAGCESRNGHTVKGNLTRSDLFLGASQDGSGHSSKVGAVARVLVVQCRLNAR
jgi:hypothetical protein